MTETQTDRNPVGRPSTYKPAYCDEVISICSQGLSLTGFAGTIGIARSTVGDWCKEHPEFALACRKALAKRALYLEIGMIDPAATGPMVTARRFALVNATMKDEPSDWVEKTEMQTTINKGAGWDEIFAQVGNKTRSL